MRFATERSLSSRYYDASIKTHLYGAIALRLIGLAATVRGCSDLAHSSLEKLQQLEEHNQETFDMIQRQKRAVGPGSRFKRIEAAYMEQVWYLLQLRIDEAS